MKSSGITKSKQYFELLNEVMEKKQTEELPLANLQL